MTDSIDYVIISGREGRLVIEVSGYERPATNDEYDSNWLMASVSVESGAFSGKFRAPFTTHDFARLRERLAGAVETLSGSVEFESAEGDLKLTVELSRRGTASVSGVAKPNASP